MSKLTLDEAIKHCLEEAGELQKRADSAELIDILDGLDVEACKECAADHRQLAEWLMDYKDLKAEQNDQYVFIHELMSELKEAKRLLRLAVEDFAKLDRVNTKVRNCMIPDMDCADCPLNWDSVDDSVEPCHNWRYTDEALKLIGGSENAE